MKKSLLFVVMVFTVQFSLCQVVGNCNAPYNTAESLVEILVGEGVEYSNATFSGFDCSAGYFDGTSNLGFQTGLVMATNGVESISPGGFGAGFGGGGSDSDLEEQLQLVNALNTNLNNLIILEFDFIPNSDAVTFNYIFASNEYTSFTCSQFNDIFGFFLSGPGINGVFTNNAENIALVPDPNDPTQYTTTPVIINTVNSGTPSGTYPASNCSDIDPNWQDYSVFYTDNSAIETVNYPGFVTLNATANVTACLTYHMKLAIADVADGGVNSAVFLQENSFNSLPDIEYTVESNTTNIFNPNSPFLDNIYEGCGEASIVFERPLGIGGDLLINYNISGSSILGTDYTLSNTANNQVVIIDGDSEATVIVTAINDGIIDDEEDVLIQILPLDYGCYEIQPDTIEFTIFDQPEFSIETDDLAALCSDDEVELEVIPIGGMGGLMAPPFSTPPYTFQWNGLGTQAVQAVNPTESQEYCVEVFDVCGQQAETCVTVIIEDYPDLGAITSADVILECAGDNAVINVEAIGGMGSLMTPPFSLPPYSYQWEGLGSQSSQLITATEETEFCVVITDVCGQEVDACIQVSIQEFPPIQVSSEIVYLCDSSETEICATATGGNENYSYSWSNGDGNPCLFDFPGSYTITVQDECGSQGTAEGEIRSDEATDPFFETAQMPNENFGIELNNYTPTMNGLSYQWNFGDGFGSTSIDPSNHFYDEWGLYTVSLGVTTAINNCYKEYFQDVEISPLYYFYAPNTFSPNGDNVNDFFAPSIVGSKSYEIYIYDRWGEQVFYTDDLEEKWDGSFNSEEAIAGTYVFKVLTTKQFDNITYERKGYVNLIK
jgi:gliding motility-associated-like protein